jgi:phosphopantetheinyl transferase (holo-ACP synthase)
VLPGVGGLEIMRSATALLYPEARTAALEGVRFLSPLKIFRDEAFEAEIEIVRDSGPSDRAPGYTARIFSWFVDKQGRKIGSPRVHHECRLVPEPDSPGPIERLEDWPRSVRVTEDDIYAEFFHGPGFRFLDHVVVEGHGKAVRFRYQDTGHRKAMFGDMIPGALEAVFQAAAAFGVEARGIMALPTGIERAVIHRADGVPRDGELIMVAEHLHESAEDRKVLKFDGVVADDAGTVILSLKNVELVELSTSGGFPGRVFEEVVTVEEVAAKMEQGAEDFLRETLTETEASEYARLTVPKRAREWITGRVALKSSVRRLMAASGKEAPMNSSIEIVTDDQGKPMAQLAGQPGGALGQVSLSHSNGLAMAAASATDIFQGLGVDVEVVEARTDSWVNDYFTDNEIRAAGDGDRRWLELTRMWCLKEAALKAMGTGLRFDLREIDAGSVDARGRARLEFHNHAARYLEDTPAGELEARVDEANGMVIARVLMRKAQR